MYCPNPECPHVLRTEEPAEYRQGVTTCSDCGTALVGTDPSEANHEPWPREELVPVMEILNAALVPFAKSLLQSAGIRFFIKGEVLQDLFGWGRLGPGFSVITGPPVVMVEASRAEEARELLENVGTRDDEADGPAG